MLPFRHIVVADFEFEFGGHASLEDAGRSGERPRPVCLVAKDLCSGRVWRLWRGEFGPTPPFPIGSDALFVAYYASAELGCFRALGWPKPANILDLFTEFRDRTNGLETPAGAGLIGALVYFGLATPGGTEKDGMRTCIVRGEPWTGDEREAILGYCVEDVAALERQLPAMLPRIDLPRALLRGRYMVAAAAMEFAGVPIDTAMLALLREHWTGIQDELIHAIDASYGVYDGRSFRAERWARYLTEHEIPWPRLESGELDLSDDAFRQMAKAYSAVSPMRELRNALSDLRLNDLAVGADGRNRTILSAFRSRTGRNQPSNSKSIFGTSVWLRGLIKPAPGCGVAYVDWAQQEFGIAAALSGDPAMHRRLSDPASEALGPHPVLHRQGALLEQFVSWFEALNGASGQAYRVALYLLHLRWKDGEKPIKLANGMLGIDGVSRYSKRRALEDLARRGLITVERHQRRSPVVRLNL